jgi:hypothetical protein
LKIQSVATHRVRNPLALGFDWSLFQRGIAASFEGIKR